MIRLGVDTLLNSAELKRELEGKRLALLGHPASMTGDFRHSLDALMTDPKLKLAAAFGPQHGMRGDLQDNMMETPDELDPVYGIPVFSLYGEVRRPSAPRSRIGVRRPGSSTKPAVWPSTCARKAAAMSSTLAPSRPAARRSITTR